MFGGFPLFFPTSSRRRRCRSNRIWSGSQREKKRGERKKAPFLLVLQFLHFEKILFSSSSFSMHIPNGAYPTRVRYSPGRLDEGKKFRSVPCFFPGNRIRQSPLFLSSFPGNVRESPFFFLRNSLGSMRPHPLSVSSLARRQFFFPFVVSPPPHFSASDRSIILPLSISSQKNYPVDGTELN